MSTQALYAGSGILLSPPIISWGHGITGVAAASTLMVTVQNFFGLSSGILVTKLHVRTVGATGVILIFLGLVLTSRATDLWMVLLSWGVMVGVGLSMTTPTAFVILTHYFERYRRYAIGVAVAGTGLGQILLPLAMFKLISEYEFDGACLITASISLQALPGFLLCRPRKPKPESPFGYNAGASGENVSTHRRRKFKRCRAFMKTFYHFTGFEQFSNPVLANTLICISLIYSCTVSFTAVVPLYLKEYDHKKEIDVPHLLTIMSSSDLAARILLPIFQEKLKISSRSVLMTSALIGSISRSIMEEVPYSSVVFIALIVNGVSRAATILNVNLTFAEMVPRDDLMALLGTSMVCKGISTLTVGTLLGSLHDLTGGCYKTYIHALTVVTFLTFTSWLAECIVIKWRQAPNHHVDGGPGRRSLDPHHLHDSDSGFIAVTSELERKTSPELVVGSENRGTENDSLSNDGEKDDLKKPKRKFRRQARILVFDRSSRNLTHRDRRKPRAVRQKDPAVLTWTFSNNV